MWVVQKKKEKKGWRRALVDSTSVKHEDLAPGSHPARVLKGRAMTIVLQTSFI
jgi:hypothetical protein